MTCDICGRSPEVVEPATALKRNGAKTTKEPDQNNAYHTPRCDVESLTAEYTSVEENDRKLSSPQSASMYDIETPVKLQLP